jgi:hypothetical protein
MREMGKKLAVAVCLMMVPWIAGAQEKAARTGATKKNKVVDAQYSMQALSAAPAVVAREAGVVRIEKDGTMSTLRQGKNGFTCMIALGSPMCADANSMAFFGAWMKHVKPPDGIGLTYMLKGDQGASNTDPGAMSKTADNHWVVTGPHIMIVGPGARALGLGESADADPSGPYMMWAGTPYEHAMIPVSSSGVAPKKAAEGEKKE